MTRISNFSPHIPESSFTEKLHRAAAHVLRIIQLLPHLTTEFIKKINRYVQSLLKKNPTHSKFKKTPHVTPIHSKVNPVKESPKDNFNTIIFSSVVNDGFSKKNKSDSFTEKKESPFDQKESLFENQSPSVQEKIHKTAPQPEKENSPPSFENQSVASVQKKIEKTPPPKKENSPTSFENQRVASIQKKIEKTPPQPKKENSPTSSKNQSVASVSPKGIETKKIQEFDVPDDGNCLFYAFAIGLRKKYAAFPEIQEKLQWSINPDELSGNLKTKATMLKKPAETLRQQAALFLEKNQNRAKVNKALVEGSLSHSKVIKEKIIDNESVIAIYESDIMELLESNISDAQEKIEQIVTKIEQYQKENLFLTSQLPAEDLEKIVDNLAKLNQYIPQYINMTKKPHVYCGTAQIYALYKIYQIPIKFLGNYVMKNSDQPPKGRPYQIQFDVKGIQSPSLPILTIAHVNQNHFIFIDD